MSLHVNKTGSKTIGGQQYKTTLSFCTSKKTLEIFLNQRYQQIDDETLCLLLVARFSGQRFRTNQERCNTKAM